MDVILYASSTCPKCHVLAQKLAEAGINFTVLKDEAAANAGINEVPVLEVNGNRMKFVDANKWINENKNGGQH